MSSKHAPINSMCHVNINDKDLELLENLCGNILLGLDFQKQHTTITFLHGGAEPELKNK